MFKNRMFMQPFYNADLGGGAGTGGDPNGGTDPNAGNTDPNGGAGTKTNEGGEKTFTQAELEAIVKDRLAREKRKADEKAEQARKDAEAEALKEQGKYKEMYEALQKDLDAQKAQMLEVRKETLLLGAGYEQEKIERLKKYLTGNTEEELATALETLKADIPPTTQYVDPATAGNGGKQGSKQEDPAEFGKSLFARLKEKGRIR